MENYDYNDASSWEITDCTAEDTSMCTDVNGCCLYTKLVQLNPDPTDYQKEWAAQSPGGQSGRLQNEGESQMICAPEFFWKLWTGQNEDGSYLEPDSGHIYEARCVGDVAKAAMVKAALGVATAISLISSI